MARAYGDFQNVDEVRDMASAARQMPSREARYRNLILNQRVELNSPFVWRSVWMGCAFEVAREFYGYPVLSFVLNVVMPYVGMFETAIKRSLLTPEDRRAASLFASIRMSGANWKA